MRLMRRRRPVQEGRQAAARQRRLLALASKLAEGMMRKMRLRLLLRVRIVLVTTIETVVLRSVVCVLIWLVSPARRSSLSVRTFRP